MQNVKINIALASISIFILWPSVSFAQGWSYQFEPYVLATSIEGDAGIGRVNGAPIDVGVDDILEALDMTAMVHFEAHNDNGWGYILDYGFMDLSADIHTPRGGIVDASVRQGVFEALANFRKHFQSSQLDTFFGMRWWDNDIDVDINIVGLNTQIKVGIEEDWIDFVVGLRWINQLNNNWSFIVSGDIGGLSAEADFTSSVTSGFQYSMSENWVLDMRYKATWVDYSDGSKGEPGYFSYNTVTHGPLVGLIYNF